MPHFLRLKVDMRILIADDHALVREGLRLIIESSLDMRMEVVGEATNGEEALKLTHELHPDVVLMDVSMPEMDGAQATRRVRESYPGVKVLAVSAYRDEGHIRQLVDAGASGYVLKKSASTELIQAIHRVKEGGFYYDSSIIGDTTNNCESPMTEEVNDERLSSRDLEVLMDVALGHTNQEIAHKMQVSVKTIEGHKAKIGLKIGLKTRAEIVRYALRRGWLNDE
jgi:two-component system response regulator NreC